MANKIGISTGKGFIEVYKDANGVLKLGDYKIPLRETLYDGDGITRPTAGASTGIVATTSDWLEITYAVDADQNQWRRAQINGEGWLLDYDDGLKGAFVYIGNGKLLWGSIISGSDPIIYRVDKVIV